MAAKRILIVVSFSNVAGAPIAALRLAHGLREQGHDPRVVFLYRKAEVDHPDHPYEVLWRHGDPGPGGYLRIARGFLGVVRAFRPDVMLTFLPLAHAVGQGSALLAGVPVRVAAHRMPIDTAQKPLRLVDLAYAWLGVYTNVTAVSRSVLATCKDYPARLRNRARVIYNGLLGWTPSPLSPAQARAKFGIPDRALVLVTLGRIAEQKNFPLLMRILQRLDDDVILAVAGDGPLRPQIESSIAELGISKRVMLLGNVQRPDMPDLLAAGDLFVQTSTYEGNSNSMLEALKSGAVILAHDVPEQREVLADDAGGVAGALVPLNDLEAWVETIRRFQSDPDLRRRSADMARQRAEVFSYDRMVAGYEAVISGN